MDHRFLEATEKGYVWACSHHEEAVTILEEAARHKGVQLTADMLLASMEELSPHVLDIGAFCVLWCRAWLNRLLDAARREFTALDS